MHSELLFNVRSHTFMCFLFFSPTQVSPFLKGPGVQRWPWISSTWWSKISTELAVCGGWWQIGSFNPKLCRLFLGKPDQIWGWGAGPSVHAKQSGGTKKETSKLWQHRPKVDGKNRRARKATRLKVQGWFYSGFHSPFLLWNGTDWLFSWVICFLLTLRQKTNGLDHERLSRLCQRHSCRCHRGNCFKRFQPLLRRLHQFLARFWGMQKPKQDMFASS